MTTRVPPSRTGWGMSWRKEWNLSLLFPISLPPYTHGGHMLKKWRKDDRIADTFRDGVSISGGPAMSISFIGTTSSGDAGTF